MRRALIAQRRGGFSLVEVMVALTVISIGLLGIAKMQALALSSTGTARMRSLASIEAASLASTMRADRTYWSKIPASLAISVGSSGGVTASPDTSLNTAPASGCAAVATPPCTPAEIAAEDLSEWATSLNQVLPNGTAAIQCTVDGTGATPVSCSIQLTWTENLVALNTATSTASSAAQNTSALQNVAQTSYTLYVDP